jgi:hypothetical protein
MPHLTPGRKPFLCLLLAFTLATTSCGGARSQSDDTVTRSLDPSSGEYIRLQDDFVLDIPAGAVASETEVSVSVVERPPVSDPEFSLIGTAYEVLTPGGLFVAPVKMEFPYNPADIPSGMREEDIRVMYRDEQGAWVLPLDQQIDTGRNVVTVESIHNGLWSLTSFVPLALDRFLERVRVELGYIEALTVPDTVQEAEAQVRVMRQEFYDAVAESEIEFEELEESISVDELRKAATEGIQLTLEEMKVLGILEAGGYYVAVRLAEKLFAVVEIAHGSLFALEVTSETGGALSAWTKVSQAYRRLRVAEAMLYILKNPDFESIPPEWREPASMATAFAEAALRMPSTNPEESIPAEAESPPDSGDEEVVSAPSSDTGGEEVMPAPSSDTGDDTITVYDAHFLGGSLEYGYLSDVPASTLTCSEIQSLGEPFEPLRVGEFANNGRAFNAWLDETEFLVVERGSSEQVWLFRRTDYESICGGEVASAPPSSGSSGGQIVTEPDDYVFEYFEAITNQDYARAWASVTQDFRNHYNENSFDHYVSGFQEQNLCRVTVSNVRILSETSSTAEVFATVTYYRDAGCDSYPYDFIFLFVKENGVWKLNRVRYP